MRILVLAVIFISLPALLLAATSERIVLKAENMGVSPLDKLESSRSATAFEFNLAGVETESKDVSGTVYKKVIPIADVPELFGETAKEGLPDLPVMAQLVAIPDQAGVRVEIVSSSYEVIENFEALPCQPAMAEGSREEAPFIKDEAFYAKNEFFPQEIVSLGEPIICRDLRMMQVVVNPVQYNPATKELRVYTDIDFRLSYEGIDTRNMKARRDNKISEAFLPLYKALTPNADEMLASYEPVRGGYLIITKQMFVDSLKQVAAWKHKKGYEVHVAPTTEINPNGTPTAAQIFTYIQNAYNTWDVPPEYVMIVGDKDNTSSTGIVDWPYSGYNSDNHFSAVDGSDFIPDIFLARLSVDNITDLRKAAAKIIMYEVNPNMVDTAYWLRGLSVGGNIYSTTPRITVLWVRQLLFDYGFTQVDTSFSWDGYPDPGPTAITNSLNNGVSIVSYRGWAGPSGWYNPSFNVSNLNALQNNNELGIMASVVCGTGDFGDSYTDPCFGETWIRMGASPTQLKGGPAFFGTTDHSTHTRWNNPIMVGYYWGIFKENNYHFASAAVRGKLQQYNTFPGDVDPGETVEKYFHTYNMLGDPEVEVRTAIPKAISVSHPASLPFGVNHIEINVVDGSSNPVEGAYATLVKGYGASEEVFEVGKTDAAGNVFLSFDATTLDTMFVTVSGRNLIPYQGHVMITQASVAVGFDSLVVADGADGIPNPDESIELSVILRNFGNALTATGVSAFLEPIDSSLVTVLDNNRLYGDIPPAQRGYSYPFVIQINPGAQDGDIARLKLSVSDQGGDFWYSVIELLVAAPKFVVNSVTFPGGNGRLDPGETVNMILQIGNQGSSNAYGVTGTVTTEDDYASIVTPSGSFGDIAVGGTGSNTGTPMSVNASSSAFNGRTINLILNTTTSSGAAAAIPFTVTVGAVTTVDPTGPDTYGYYMYDNTDAAYAPRPTYTWVEINPNLGGSGTILDFGGNTDDKSALVTLPFDFLYYGQIFRHLIVCTNGFVSPDTTRFEMGGNFWYNFFNWPIPDPGCASGQMSPFWDDLQFTGAVDGVYTWYDVANHRYIIEWSHMTHRNSGSAETFQMIITNPAYHPTITGDAEIVYQYNTIANNDSEENYASVGFESFDELRGLQYTFNNAYNPGAASLAANRAIKITTNTGWGAIRGHVDLVGQTSDRDATVTVTGGQHRLTPASGDYWMRNVAPGTVNATAQASGFFPSTVTGVAVTINQTTPDVNFTLQPCPNPSGLTASENLGDRIEINWSGLTHPNLAGYNLYRSLWENGEFVKVNSSPIVGASFTDTGLDPVTYWYYVTAAFSGTDWTAESKPSNRDSGITFLAVPDISYGPSAVVDTVIEGNAETAPMIIRNLGTGRLIVGLRAIEFNLAPREGDGIAAPLTLNGKSSDLLDDDPPHILNTWLFVSPAADTIAAGDSAVININLSATFVGEGDYLGQISITSNDPDAPTATIPVTMRVRVMSSNCQYIPGDINGNGAPNGIDVGFGVNYFKGGPLPPVNCASPTGPCPQASPFYAAGDVNGNCQFNGIDVTFFVNYLKGIQPSILYCPTCPPAAALNLPAMERPRPIRLQAAGNSGS